MSSRVRFALISACALILTLSFVFAVYWWQRIHVEPVAYKTAQEEDTYVRFDMEAYDDIQNNYWQKASDSDLSQFFQLATQKAIATSTELQSKERRGVSRMIAEVIKGKTETEKKQIVADIVKIVLYNLPPLGRGQLLLAPQAQDLINTVTNVNPQKDLYGDVGAKPGATVAEINAAYKEKKAALAATTSESGKMVLKNTEYAHEVLTNQAQKQLYDENKIEPTIFTHLLGAHTLYLYIEKVSPTTLAEFTRGMQDFDANRNLTALILDLRGNIGGSLDFVQPFLALFFGPNQYAFDLFHQGELQAQRTSALDQLPALKRFREIAILTDGMTQSTGEMIASSLKHDHLAYIVGTKTRGWGSIEKLLPMQTVIDPKENYTLLLVISLTVRDDGNPIEGNGVLPNVDTSDANWKSELTKYFYSQELISQLQTRAEKPPLKI